MRKKKEKAYFVNGGVRHVSGGGNHVVLAIDGHFEHSEGYRLRTEFLNYSFNICNKLVLKKKKEKGKKRR
jgi:hypothetical protein